MSSTIGFIIVATVTFTFFILVFAIGYPVYYSQIDSGHMQNMEKSFSLLAYNANMVATQKAMVSSTEIKMYGGTLATRDTGVLSLNVFYYADENGTVPLGKGSSGNFILSSLEYSKGAARIAYVDGSVCRYDTNGAVMLEEPEIANGTGFLLIPMINLYKSNVSIAGDTLTRIAFITPYFSKTLNSTSSPGSYTVPNVKNVTIKMSGNYSPCFSRYFQEKLGYGQSPAESGALNLSRTYPQGINLTIVARADVSIDVN